MNPVTLLIVAGTLVGLAVAGGLVLILRDPGTSRRRLESLFRKAPEAHKVPGNEHYYRPYWSR